MTTCAENLVKFASVRSKYPNGQTNKTEKEKDKIYRETDRQTYGQD